MRIKKKPLVILHITVTITYTLRARPSRQSLRQEGSHAAALLRDDPYIPVALRAALWHF